MWNIPIEKKGGKIKKCDNGTKLPSWKVKLPGLIGNEDGQLRPIRGFDHNNDYGTITKTNNK